MITMGEVWSYDYEKNKPLKAGTLLLAEPFLYDDNFRRSAILLCEHNSQGSVGLIINRPLDVLIHEAVPDFPPFDARIFWGGPVGTDSLQFLHSVPDLIDGGTEICEGVFWGGNFERVAYLADTLQISSKDIHFYIGYSGWGDKQLEDEIKDNSWIITQGVKSTIFSNSSDTLWRNTLTTMGGIYAKMALYPENPILN